MGEEQNRDNILDLVRWVDSRQAELFRKYDGLRGEMTRIVLGLIVLFLVVWLVMYEYQVAFILKGQFGFEIEIVVISTQLSAFAVVIAGFTLLSPYLEKNEVEVRFKRALDLRGKEANQLERESGLHAFQENEKPFLKALIEIRSKNEGFTLEQLYDLDKSRVVFSKERLLKRLCK